MGKPIIIAIDGYSSSGKSSFAKEIAKELRYIYVDTGAIYRAITLFALNNGAISDDNKIDEERLRRLLFEKIRPEVTFEISNSDGSSFTCLDGENVEKEIRTLKISNAVSHIAAIPFVREFVNTGLRKYGISKGIVMDGRDIGTAIFPDAELKLFMTASPEIRAERRLKELAGKGEKANYEDVLKNIKERDFIDAHRDTDPLQKAGNAILLDNSNMTIEEQLVWIRKILREKYHLL